MFIWKLAEKYTSPPRSYGVCIQWQSVWTKHLKFHMTGLLAFPGNISRWRMTHLFAVISSSLGFSRVGCCCAEKGRVRSHTQPYGSQNKGLSDPTQEAGTGERPAQQKKKHPTRPLPLLWYCSNIISPIRPTSHQSSQLSEIYFLING